MSGDAIDPHFESRRAVDRGHDPERQPVGLQDRSLLDMRLDERGDAGPPDRPCPLGIAAEGLERFAHRDAARTPLVERVLRISPGESARAGEGGAKADTLLVAEGDDFNRVIEALGLKAQAVQ